MTPAEFHKIYDSLNQYGKSALNSITDEQSDYRTHSHDIIYKRFYINAHDIGEIYHYTSISALKNIVQTKLFYVGYIHSMNDPLEVRYTYRVAIEYLKQLDATKAEIDAFINDYQHNNFDSYVWSFSPNRNSQALGNYGDVALGFDSQKIQQKLSAQYTSPDFQHMGEGYGYVFPLKVEYNQKTHKAFIMPIIKEWLDAYRGLRGVWNSVAIDIRKRCLSSLFLLSLCFKRQILWQEEEIRYVIVKPKSNHFDASALVSDRPISLAQINPNILREVVLSRNSEGRKQEVKDILTDNGFSKTKVKITDLPY
ncbi:hypothetical protein DY120_05235 [Apilactobacillus micheneri]|uniref:Uncharacterized protein n=1 Tax=Apilactobacillus micheneri TaxID=1899430 RepID=A0ABY2YWF7_9LACO|nr:hypothetical protein [Apilactobacillus micheneri]TPR24683.1 hypothetical protein DY114_05235 [Apilactobacillus micheneri]TPR25994.1 hypothetical protein DY111_05235 [Apilactobacillus micheneri]TPR28184.1 hypothetical protein DY113_03180 [Apilactobacillus micheneri]TPR29675.1 hypothetical protein DY117_05235 [Apilactobacillus micheneri]TPR30461.1 hypothetical protein DY120_05235 [Apilactobacillus micheneri]